MKKTIKCCGCKSQFTITITPEKEGVEATLLRFDCPKCKLTIIEPPKKERVKC